jgi:hypothetical protein
VPEGCLESRTITLRHARTAIGIAGLVVVWFGLFPAIPAISDAHAYWTSLRGGWYTTGVATPGAFLYPPPAALVMAPFAQLPWLGFAAVLTAANLAALAWLVGPIAAVVLAFVPPVQTELLWANVHLLVAAAIVAGIRRPGWWALPLLTKVTPAIGLLWFAGRADWRAIGKALTVGAFLIAITLPLIGAWIDWFAVLAASHPLPQKVLLDWPLSLRLPLAATLAIAAGRLNWPVVVPVATYLALPIMWVNGVVLLLGCWRASRLRASPLDGPRHEDDPESPKTAGERSCSGR